MEYDPLLAKLIGYGESREQAIGRLRRALDEYHIGGIKTNLSLFRRVLQDPDFLSGKTDTGFLSRLPGQQQPTSASQEDEVAVIGAGLFQALSVVGPNSANSAGSDASHSAWKQTARQEALS